MKTTMVKMVDVTEWDNLVEKTYGKPYSFQQQDGCQSRGIVNIEVPGYEEDYESNSIIERVNGPEMGVSFQTWLARDPETHMKDDEGEQTPSRLNIFWQRNFYPDISMIVSDLHKRGLIEDGDFTIEIDW